MPRTLGIIGYGHFGTLVHELVSRFAPGVKVMVHSSRADASQEFFVGFEQAAACDIVVPCVPIAAFEATVEKLLLFMREDATLVDVATVKVHTVTVLKRLMPGRRWLATHAMFGPESYEKTKGDVGGYRIVIADGTLPPAEREAVEEFLRTCGFQVVAMSAELHDKHLAETLFLTHFIGQIVERGKFGRTDIDTVSFGFLMHAVEIVRSSTALFQDVYRFNPFCEEVLRRFEVAEHEVHALLQGTGGNEA